MLIQRKQLLLADDMGLGKTIQAIAAIRVLLHRGNLSRALIVVPAGLLEQWMREITFWARELRVMVIAGAPDIRLRQWRYQAHITLVSYETLRSDYTGSPQCGPCRERWGVVVLDEASRIKNRETGVTTTCKALPAERRWALTGTPLENRIDDVISILDFLSGGREHAQLRKSSPSEIRERLKEVQLRRKKEDVLKELPPKQVIEQIIDLLPNQREAYDRAEQQGIVRLKEAGHTITVTHVLELIMRLKQICNNHPVTNESAKLDDIENRIETLVEEGHRALVFSQFTDSSFGVQMIAMRLNAFSPLTFTGAMSAEQKTSNVDIFTTNTKHKALILSLRAGGVGLNLQAASYVFHLDRWWNPALEEQADSRSHRMGQTHPVTVYRYICQNTIEERIDALLRDKRGLFEHVVDDVSLDLGASLTENEIFGLFGLNRSYR